MAFVLLVDANPVPSDPDGNSKNLIGYSLWSSNSREASVISTVRSTVTPWWKTGRKGSFGRRENTTKRLRESQARTQIA